MAVARFDGAVGGLRHREILLVGNVRYWNFADRLVRAINVRFRNKSGLRVYGSLSTLGSAHLLMCGSSCKTTLSKELWISM